MLLEEIIEKLTLFLKENGYRKNKLNWYRQKDELTIVFSIQRSQYSKEQWYYNFGIGIDDLVSGKISVISKCHIIERLENRLAGRMLSLDDLSRAIMHWESKYGDISELRYKAIENKLPKMTTKQAISYLTTVKS